MNHKEYMKSLCYQHMNKPVVLHTADNQQIQGIIENVDDDYVHMLVPTDMPMSESMMNQGQMMAPSMMPSQGQMISPAMTPAMIWDQGQMMSPTMTLAPMANRQWFGYPSFYPYYWGPRPFRRFLFPLAALTAISLLPFY